MKATRGRLAPFIEQAVKHEVLSRDEERALAVKYRKGAKIDERGKVTKPTAIGKPAGEKLVAHNLRFALREAHSFRRFGFPLEDLFQVAVEGLMEARDRYDPTRNNGFVTYARWWTKAKLHRYCTHAGAGIFFNPARVENLAYAVAKIRNLEPGLSDREILERAAGKLKIPIDLAHQMYARRYLGVSTEEPLFADCDTGPSVGDGLVDAGPLPDEIAIDKEEKQNIREAATGSARNPREREIMMRRWLTDEGATLATLADKYQRSRERIRQNEVQLLARTKAKLGG